MVKKIHEIASPGARNDNIVMATLYRKYRPQTFKEAVGQNHIKVTLQNEIGTGKTAHAYLFCGPRAVGKTTFARLMAKAVNCLNRKEGEYEPCDKCASCLDIIAGRSLDIVEIDAASHTGVDNVRENIIASARVAPSKYKYKVFIIDEVHMLSISAFNALLKVIEEPPAHVIFILCTTEIHKVPATIISRCERFDFRRISVEDMVKKLTYIVKEEGIKVAKDILEDIARQAEGHLRDAEGLLGQLVSIAGKEITREEADLVIPRSDIAEIVKLLEILIKKDAAGGISLVNKLLDDGVDLEKFAGDLIEVLRKVMLSKINPALGERLGLDIGESFEIKINDLKKNLEISQLILFLEKFIVARAEMKNSFITQLPLELALAELCSETGKPMVKIGAVTANAVAANRAPAVSAPIAPVEKINLSNASLNKDLIISRWNEVLAKIKKYNHSLSFILHLCQPRDVSGNKICLAFKYKFHKDRIDEAKMKEIIQNVLREVYGATLQVEAVIDENMEVSEVGNKNHGLETELEVEIPAEGATADDEVKNGKDMMSDLLKTFGGKIVG
ncbi:MAG TPA: DNA polymerase III subunit gamma/tau [Candidatus Methylomirabilis sp.]|nr:DNA polymerase III subunit gamma/tau [Candidatus Methylomirabilis sp.]